MSEENRPAPTIDVGQLAIYLDKANQIASVSKMMAGVYLQDLIKGQDIAGQLVAKAVQADIKAKARLEQAEAIAYLDKAGDYLASKQIKDSSETRKRYIDIDVDVIAAKDHKAMTEAMVSLFKNKLSVLRQSHDDLKRIAYSDQYLSGYEGM
jgi:hypothetical protein